MTLGTDLLNQASHLKYARLVLAGTMMALALQTAPARASEYALQPSCPAVPPPGGVVCYTPATAPRLRRNSQGQMVRNWQNFLQRMGYFKGPVTGFYGPQTEEAVKQFQRATGLQADGIVGPATWRGLIRANAG